MANENYYMKIDLLGRIYIKDMIIFYDEPLVFSCVNDFGNLFIANKTVSEFENEEWIFLPISEAKLIKGLRGNISAYELFSKPEGEFLWKVCENGNNLAKAFKICPKTLTDDNLPDKKAFYKIYDDDLLTKKTNELISISSKKERREILDLSLEPNFGHSHEISCELLSKVLNQLQSTIYYIASKDEGEPLQKTKDENKLDITGAYAASFGIRLKSHNLSDLLGESKCQKNLKILMNLLESKGNYNIIKDISNKIGSKAILKYNKLLKTLLDNNMGIKTECAFPNSYYKSIRLGKNDIQKSILTLESQVKDNVRQFEKIGNLVGINVDQRTFEFIDSDKEKFKGSIDNSLNIKEYRLPKYVKVKIEEKLEYNEVTQKEVYKYKLIYLDYLNNK